MSLGTHLSDFELIVMLVLLRLGDEAYGVPIAREIDQQTGREVKLGSVYAVLERLEEKGFVASELGEPTQERGGRAKRYFHVTKRGIREVRDARQILTRLWQGVVTARLQTVRWCTQNKSIVRVFRNYRNIPISLTIGSMSANA